jgi:hypothetical protein
MKYGMRSLIVVAYLLLAARPGHASIVATTFGSGMSYNTGEGVTISGTGNGAGYFAQANTFTPSGNWTLDSVSVPILGQNGLSMEILIAADNGTGHPGTIVEDLGSLTPNFQVSIMTINSTARPLLTSGTAYWLILQPSNSSSDIVGGWNFSSPATPPGERRTSPTGSWTTSPFQGEAYQINGTAVPEPSSILLVGLGAAFGYYRFRRSVGRADVFMGCP